MAFELIKIKIGVASVSCPGLGGCAPSLLIGAAVGDVLDGSAAEVITSAIPGSAVVA
ncbi:chloride channel F [Actinidia rufa]|uniref:Chloride channel F n=1 Tax=Actinidia rufa TaxID=165716 RepID=A0A7J0DVW1_9ERIC|nr:chloride channel F [Actinidia rufa]